MYESDDLKVTTPYCEEYLTDEDNYCDHEYTGERHTISDSGGEYKYCGPGIAYLEHRCNHWVIGGAKEIQQFINDLQSILGTINVAK